jgi:hypothetical protein
MRAPDPRRAAGLGLEFAARQRVDRTRPVRLERGRGLGYMTRSSVVRCQVSGVRMASSSGI